MLCFDLLFFLNVLSVVWDGCKAHADFQTMMRDFMDPQREPGERTLRPFPFGTKLPAGGFYSS